MDQWRPFLQGFIFHKILTIWPLLIQNDNWPSLKAIVGLEVCSFTYLLHSRSIPACDLRISSLNNISFSRLDHCCRQMACHLHKKQKELLLFNLVHLHMKCEMCSSFPSWDSMFRSFSQYDSFWPQMILTPTEITSWILVSREQHLYTYYEVGRSLSSWYCGN